VVIRSLSDDAGFDLNLKKYSLNLFDGYFHLTNLTDGEILTSRVRRDYLRVTRLDLR